MLVAGLGPAARAACPATSGDLAVALGRADDAWVAMDLDGFNRAAEEARETLSCLSLPVTPADAAAFHRMEALAAWVRKDRDATVAAFRAVVEVQPDYAIPETVAPPGNPLHAAFEEARHEDRQHRHRSHGALAEPGGLPRTAPAPRAW